MRLIVRAVGRKKTAWIQSCMLRILSTVTEKNTTILIVVHTIMCGVCYTDRLLRGLPPFLSISSAVNRFSSAQWSRLPGLRARIRTHIPLLIISQSVLVINEVAASLATSATATHAEWKVLESRPCYKKRANVISTMHIHSKETRSQPIQTNKILLGVRLWMSVPSVHC